MSKRIGIQLCYPFEERRLLKWTPPWIVQPKLNGDRMRAIIGEDGTVALLSSEAIIRTSIPHINQALRQSGLRNIELDGEAYTHGMSLYEINGICSRTINLHPDFLNLEFHIFDLVLPMPQEERLILLESLRKQIKPPIHIVPFEVAETLEDVFHAYDKFLSLNYEGIVIRDHAANYVRKRSTQVMKFKPKKKDYYRIVGYTQEKDKYGILKEGRLGSLTCLSNVTGETFNVGSGYTDDARYDLWSRRETLIGKIACVGYQHMTPKGVPPSSVFVEVVEPSWEQPEE